jgi:homogentisate 1,2-dioxygenase
MDHLPFNVAAWHGNYVPYKYDLKRFCVVNSVSYDHLDPSIYTVLTCPSLKTGTALADVVIFPPRYMATDKNTFRPPWFHRNCMSEYMGLIYGEYDAKQHTDGSGGGDFVPGGSSLHNCMIPHGPDQMTCQKAFDDACETPAYFDKGLAFMFESCLVMKMSPQLELLKQDDYAQCWNGLEGRVDWKEIQANKKND